jgi:hypothetical protein
VQVQDDDKAEDIEKECYLISMTRNKPFKS